jgi:hypothetical protein
MYKELVDNIKEIHLVNSIMNDIKKYYLIKSKKYNKINNEFKRKYHFINEVEDNGITKYHVHVVINNFNGTIYKYENNYHINNNITTPLKAGISKYMVVDDGPSECVAFKYYYFNITDYNIYQKYKFNNDYQLISITNHNDKLYFNEKLI